MSTEQVADPWLGVTYNGFSNATELAETPPTVTPGPSRGGRNLLIGGVIGAVALGLVLGVAARPDLLRRAPDAAPMRAVATPAAGQVQVELTTPVASPVPKPTGKLEVLSPELAQAAAPAMVAQPIRAMPLYDPPPARAPQAQACGGSAAQQMVCGDPDLAQADRRMARAYRRALQSGASPGELRDEQQDWLDIREEAARRSPEAVASIYQQRIDELNALADEDPN
jgi:uncharacterized protein YecT (DUF1311 family)